MIADAILSTYIRRFDCAERDIGNAPLNRNLQSKELKIIKLWSGHLFVGLGVLGVRSDV